MSSTPHTEKRTGWKGRALVAGSLCLLLATGMAAAGCKESPPAAGPVKEKVASPAPPDARAADAADAPDAPGGAGDVPALKPLTPADAEGSALNSLDELAKRRDPFRSFIEVKEPAAAAEGKKPARRLTPLQRYSLDQLRVVGVVGGGSVLKALLEDDAGKGFVVGVGDAIGNQGGVIVSIKPDCIVVREIYSNALGEETARMVTKKLYAVETSGTGGNP